MGLGVLTILVAGVMLLLGLQLTGLFPKLENIKIALPAGLARRLGIKTKSNHTYSDKSAMLAGAGTFFLPCGFTQAMQLYAMTTGNFVSGALIMATFAIGTAPGLLGIGGLTAVLKGKKAQMFYKFAGVVVVVLAIFNFQNGINLTGFNSGVIPSLSQPVKAAANVKIEREGEKQVIRMTQTSNGYSPNKLTVVKGVPVKWIVTSKDPYSCSASILASKAGIRTMLKEGENVLEFTPTETGTIPFSCLMGMYRGSISVVDPGEQVKLGSAVQVAANNPSDNTGVNTAAGASCGSGGGGCGCGGAAKNAVPVAGQANVDNGVQVLKTVYTSANDISPNQFRVTAGKPVSLEIDAKDDGSGCMSAIMVPGLSQSQLLTAGKVIKLVFTPTKKGKLPITCAMGVPRGYINVE
jgi:plastocyanin domain-containing protein